VLLLHGFGGDLNAWAFNQEALAAGRAVHALDLPAHGASDPLADAVDVAGLARAVAALELGRVHLVGHSLGGAVALELARTVPDRVASLALIAPVGLGPDLDAGYVEGFLAAERRKAMRAVLGKLYRAPEQISNDMVEGVLRAKRLDGVPEALRAIASSFVDANGRQLLDLRPVLEGLAVPCIVIWGAEDGIIPPAQADGLPAAVRVERIAGTAHMPQVEDASAVNRLLAEHLARAEGGAP
jgi:pyruvate dehydrogenase E2 component (dihydrolipoamide acetyltransferase)